MPARAWERLSDFLDPQDFADEIVIETRAGTIRPNVIFDDPYMNVNAGEYDATTRQPRITGTEAELAGVVRGDTATINGVTYDVTSDVLPDGTGMAMVELAPC